MNIPKHDLDRLAGSGKKGDGSSFRAPIRLIVDRYGKMLRSVLGDDLLCAFVYGSVARGQSHALSDIDVFCIVRTLERIDRNGINARAVALQRMLGYTPDEVYPIEVFSEHLCRQVLTSVGKMNNVSIGFDPGQKAVNEDRSEIANAFTDVKIIVTGRTWLREFEGSLQSSIEGPSDGVCG